MSTIKVANVHFETTGSNRIDYRNDDVIYIVTANAEFSGTINAAAVLVNGAPLEAGGGAAFDAANTAQTTASAAYDQANTSETIAIAAYDQANAGGGGAATYYANVGNSSANSFTISHSLNKDYVIPAVRENSSGYYVYPDIRYVDANNIVLEFVTAPTTNQYTIIVLG